LTLAIGFERGLDARFFLRRQCWRLVFDSLDDVAACGKLSELCGNVLAVPSFDPASIIS